MPRYTLANQPLEFNMILAALVVHGQWGDWSEWGRCSAYSECSPGGKEAEKQKNVYGLVKRTRNCDNPAPKHGGAECEGALESTKRCKVAHCPGMCKTVTI